MQIGELLKEYEKPKERTPSHERAYWIDLTIKMLGKDQKGKERTFGQMLGLTRNWSVIQIRDLYFEASKKDNPPAFWWWKRKQLSNNK
jgi:hypothetical protein